MRWNPCDLSKRSRKRFAGLWRMIRRYADAQASYEHARREASTADLRGNAEMWNLWRETLSHEHRRLCRIGAAIRRALTDMLTVEEESKP